jgi:hypothetical protein
MYENLENTIKELNRIIDIRFNVFGAIGKYKKSRYTKSGNLTKNNEFIYPHKNELLNIKKRLMEIDETNYNEVKSIEKEICIFIIVTQDEFIKAKNMKGGILWN